MRTLVGPQPSPGASDAKGLNPYSEALNALDRKNQQGESKRAVPQRASDSGPTSAPLPHLVSPPGLLS